MNSALAQPSRTSQAVALTRAGLDRPHSPAGDPGAQRALCAGMTVSPPSWLAPGIGARTKFFDEQVLAALAAGLRQVVICGAGYDDRALRFRAGGVRFFELDHPATQADKARRLLAMNAAGPGLVLAAADFRTDDGGAVLGRSGHDRELPSLFLCEGLLVYLDQPTCGRLLAGLASRAAAGSVLAASLATHADGLDSAEVAAAANARRRTGGTEPWHTILPVPEHLALLEQAGWIVTGITDSPVPSADVSHGRRSILVTASPAG
jgi:methyltransferase (TIGR00027 family)